MLLLTAKRRKVMKEKVKTKDRKTVQVKITSDTELPSAMRGGESVEGPRDKDGDPASPPITQNDRVNF